MAYAIKEVLTSLQNQRIKNFQHLQKASERRGQNVFIVEGLNEIRKAVKKGYHFRSVFFYPELISASELFSLLGEVAVNEIFEVSKAVYEKIAYRENSGGVVVLAEPKKHGLELLKLPENPLVVVLESVEKPGNLGALLRTADAAGVDAFIVCDPQTDLYNPNVVRSSIGCVFTVPIAVADSASAIDWLKKKNIRIYCTYLQAAVPYHTINYRGASAIVMGTESTGLTRRWTDVADQNIIIPMRGEADSMNVSVAAAIVIFEACRQRGFQ
jgi:TrmH family RNA methyltransferase